MTELLTTYNKYTLNGKHHGLIASVIIPTYNQPKSLINTLTSVQTQNFDKEKYEIIVVNNGLRNETAKEIEECIASPTPHVRFIHEPEEGLHNARHTGAREASGEILVYVDDDVIVTYNWLKEILLPFQMDSSLGCVGGKILPQWECEPLDSFIKQFPCTYLSILDLGEKRRELSWPEGVYGCNLAIRRSVLYEVGGFNPDAYGNKRFFWLRGDGETGLHRKLYDQGYKVIYAPEALVYHYIPTSRLRSHYFYRRAFMQGISDSYSQLRQNPSRFHLLKNIIKCFINSWVCFLKFFRQNSNCQSKAEAWYWAGQWQHKLHALVSKKLFAHIIQETYFL